MATDPPLHEQLCGDTLGTQSTLLSRTRHHSREKNRFAARRPSDIVRRGSPGSTAHLRPGPRCLAHHSRQARGRLPSRRRRSIGAPRRCWGAADVRGGALVRVPAPKNNADAIRANVPCTLPPITSRTESLSLCTPSLSYKRHDLRPKRKRSSFFSHVAVALITRLLDCSPRGVALLTGWLPGRTGSWHRARSWCPVWRTGCSRRAAPARPCPASRPTGRTAAAHRPLHHVTTR